MPSDREGTRYGCKYHLSMDVMKNLGKLLLLLLLLAFRLGQAQWTPINLSASRQATAMGFLSDDLGYAIMYTATNQELLEKTTDGGQSWTTLNLPVQGPDLQAMNFYAPGKGVAVFRDLNNNVKPTQLYMTADDGATWQEIGPDSTATGIGNASTQFLNDLQGFLTTDDYFYRTVDGGATWTTMQMSGYPMSIDFLDADHGTVGLFDGTFNYFGGIAATADGGATWQTTWLTDNGTVIGKVGQWTTTSSWAAPVNFGAYGQTRFFKTTNNGLSWDTIQVPDTLPDAALSGIDFKDPMQGVITVTSFTTTISYQTNDGGATWAWLDTLPYFGVTDLVLTATTGYLAGEIGKIHRLDGTLGLNETISSSVHVFPNPARVGQRVRWDDADQFTTVELTDLAGRSLHRAELSQPEFVLPDVPKGLYLIRLMGATQNAVSKLLIE
jgi:photosystem II stability/assembly factor-like uncharacterized protein